MPICAQCGAANRDKARFCDECGSQLEEASTPESTALPPALAAIANGRYELRSLLGEGGKKRVYLARDSLLDREVALALIKSEGLDASARARVLREAQAMGRLGAHPHIVTVFDLGDEDGQPYLVTELMAGGDLEGLIERAPGGRVPIAQVLELAKCLCKGLAFAHEQGLVHRDLKPGNVWLTTDGQPKIGDFGLALPLERSRLTQEGTIVGTVAYLPPEQALGGEVTPRADLYSLGALLYELLTGRPPFLGDDLVSVISQHIHTPPVAPSWHAPDCPRALDALVTRLLAKDPSERPPSAVDVLAALEAIDLAEIVEPLVPDPADAHSLDSLAGGVFVGRRQELGELKAALEGALSGDGRMMTLVGEPGIGKSRTALELATYARLRGAQVLWGRCYESEGAPPYWPWVQAIRSYVRERDPAELRGELGAGAADIAEVVPDVRQRLPDLGAAATFDDPQQARFRLFDSLTAFLKSASLTQPFVLVLDDLHWADEGSLRLLEFIAHELVRRAPASDRHLPGRRALASPSPLEDARGAHAGAPLQAARPARPEPGGRRPFHRGYLRRLAADRARQHRVPPDRGQPAFRHRGRPAPCSGGRADSRPALRARELEHQDPGRGARGDRETPRAPLRTLQRGTGGRVGDREGVRARPAREADR